MRRVVLSIWAVMLLAAFSYAQRSAGQPLVEAREVSKAYRYSSRRLWVRVTAGGELQWEDSADGKSNVHSTQIDQKQIELLVQTLSRIDWNQLHGKIGPFNVYIDSSIEINVSVNNGRHTFFLLNPWPGVAYKPIPPDAKKLLCQLDNLRSQASGSAVHPMCAQ